MPMIALIMLGKAIRQIQKIKLDLGADVDFTGLTRITQG